MQLLLIGNVVIMDITRLIRHPERLNRETLYDLRSLVALYPYYQPARLLMLQNLYILHDPTFDEELRRSAIYMTSRRSLFSLIEAAHYHIHKEQTKAEIGTEDSEDRGKRTLSLIDNFLETIPDDNKEEKKPKRKPTPADMAGDYASYLMELEELEERKDVVPQLVGQSLIDDFIHKEGGRIQLKDEIEYTPDYNLLEHLSDHSEEGEGYLTETLANVYIRQAKYDKALEIIKRLNLNYPNKNTYFADQIRFLEKLIINNTKK